MVNGDSRALVQEGGKRVRIMIVALCRSEFLQSVTIPVTLKVWDG
jgi:hypothetical protein